MDIPTTPSFHRLEFFKELLCMTLRHCTVSPQCSRTRTDEIENLIARHSVLCVVKCKALAWLCNRHCNSTNFVQTYTWRYSRALGFAFRYSRLRPGTLNVAVTWDFAVCICLQYPIVSLYYEQAVVYVTVLRYKSCSSSHYVLCFKKV